MRQPTRCHASWLCPALPSLSLTCSVLSRVCPQAQFVCFFKNALNTACPSPAPRPCTFCCPLGPSLCLSHRGQRLHGPRASAEMSSPRPPVHALLSLSAVPPYNASVTVTPTLRAALQVQLQMRRLLASSAPTSVTLHDTCSQRKRPSSVLLPQPRGGARTPMWNEWHPCGMNECLGG